MDAFIINGGRRLRGSVRVHGSKNASLPLMAATLLTDQPVTLRDVPELSDIRNMRRLMTSLGAAVEREQKADAKDPAQPPTQLHVVEPGHSLAHYDIVRTMRAGICVLGPLLAKRGVAKVSMPGGCAIGDRPVDLHLRGLRALGAEIHLDEGYIVAEAPASGNGDGSGGGGGGSGGGGRRLRGAHVFLGGPNGSTVLGTANVLSAAVLAEGVTVIESAACEPEIEDLADLLTKMGAKITGAGSPRILIEGVAELHGADHTVMPDRIEAGTYVMAAAITNGDIVLENFPTAALTALLDRLAAIGIEVSAIPNGQEKSAAASTSNIPHPTSNISPSPSPPPRPTSNIQHPTFSQTVRIDAPRRLRPVHVVTQPHPGFPTDIQAQMMALLTLADGNSIITEKIFPDRFLHVAELLRMGADCIRTGPTVLVSGVRELIGAPVMASDLRASAGLVLAGLAARGTTTINRVYHLDRGYQRMETTLQHLGADIQRVDHEAV